MRTIIDIKETIFHEFGHLIVYILANKRKKTHLGSIIHIQMGLYKNLISPNKNLYYYERLKLNNHIYENSKNIERTLYWVILQFTGCLFESEYDKSDFDKLFCTQLTCHGKKDYDNLYYFNTKSSFKISNDHFDRIKKSFLNILKNHKIFERTELYLNHFLNVFNGSEHILMCEDDIKTLLEEYAVTNDFADDVAIFVNKESKNFC